ncbi:terminase small subunit [Microbulbifer thermotolerans]|uniref:terminase small subunit n=1 Tax=Microbulbifer thermotolerans TaxID=252514 RepID=UPI001587A47D
MKMNRTEMADCLSVAPTTLDAWTREGCPVEHRPGQGKAAEFDSGDVIRWLTNREKAKAAARADAGDLDELRGEKIRVETRLKELQLAREAGQLAPLEHIERALTNWVIELRTRLLALPQRVAPRILGETDESLLKAAMSDEIRQALSGLVLADLFENDEEFGGLADG